VFVVVRQQLRLTISCRGQGVGKQPSKMVSRYVVLAIEVNAHPIHADHVFNDDPTLVPLAYIGTPFIAERSVRGQQLDVWAHNSLGTYFFKLRNGQFYSGKGDRNRCKTSMMQRMVETGSGVAWYLFWPVESNEESFIMEDQLICDTGGLGSDTNHNTINSPGANLRNRRR